MTRSQMGHHSTVGVFRIGEEKSLARQWIAKLSIKASSGAKPSLFDLIRYMI